MLLMEKDVRRKDLDNGNQFDIDLSVRLTLPEYKKYLENLEGSTIDSTFFDSLDKDGE